MVKIGCSSKQSVSPFCVNMPVTLDLLQSDKIKFITIPHNCTDCLQPLDISVNKSCKDYIQACFNEKMENSDFSPIDMKMSIIKPLGYYLLQVHYASKS